MRFNLFTVHWKLEIPRVRICCIYNIKTKPPKYKVYEKYFSLAIHLLCLVFLTFAFTDFEMNDREQLFGITFDQWKVAFDLTVPKYTIFNRKLRDC